MMSRIVTTSRPDPIIVRREQEEQDVVPADRR